MYILEFVLVVKYTFSLIRVGIREEKSVGTDKSLLILVYDICHFVLITIVFDTLHALYHQSARFYNEDIEHQVSWRH